MLTDFLVFCCNCIVLLLLSVDLSVFTLFACLMKKALTETQTLHAGCSKAEPKNFAPPQTLFLGALDGQNLIS